MTVTATETGQGYTAPPMAVNEVCGDSVPYKAIDADPSFEGTVDVDPEEAVMQRVTTICLSGVCFDHQQQLAADIAPWAAAGGRITPFVAAQRVLERMGCSQLSGQPCKFIGKQK